MTISGEICASQARSPAILLVIDDETCRSAAGLPKATAETDCGGCNAAVGTIADCELWPDIQWFTISAAAGADDAGIAETTFAVTGAAVVTFVTEDPPT